MAVVLEASRLELVLASAAVTLRHKVHDTVALCWARAQTCVCLSYKGYAQIVLLKYKHLGTGSGRVVVQFSHSSSALFVIQPPESFEAGSHLISARDIIFDDFR